ncbi:MAG: hypothetical protein KatS3mg110_1991 [Pirellulaceae bacterium]|nr:MAG: hypothetical protein KatS3mg110_1991 [Pirellulaceae bacterium]
MCAEPISLHEQLTAEPIRELQRLLRDARLIHLQRPEAADKHIRGRAVAAVRNLGYCYLFGSGHVQFPPRVPVSVVRAAAKEAARLYDRWIERAVRLSEEWDGEDLIKWIETATLQRLEDRMEGEAIYVGISESLFAARREGELTSDQVNAVLAPLQDLLDQWDAVLLDEVDALSVAADEPILANWREGLTEPYRDPPPWWLSGMLEEIAREMEEHEDRDLWSFTAPMKRRLELSEPLPFRRDWSPLNWLPLRRPNTSCCGGIHPMATTMDSPLSRIRLLRKRRYDWLCSVPLTGNRQPSYQARESTWLV